MYVYWYLLFINIVTFILYCFDKYFAKKHKRRVSERTLFIMSFLGGFIGALLGMQLVKHKTKKWYFYLCNIFAGLFWLYIIYFVLKK